MHDTPEKRLFTQARRAFSHGCVRVEDPNGFAELVLDGPEWSPDAINSAIAAKQTRSVALPRKIPVYMLYWTAFVDADGTIEFRDALPQSATGKMLRRRPRFCKRRVFPSAADCGRSGGLEKSRISRYRVGSCTVVSARSFDQSFWSMPKNVDFCTGDAQLPRLAADAGNWRSNPRNVRNNGHMPKRPRRPPQPLR